MQSLKHKILSYSSQTWFWIVIAMIITFLVMIFDFLILGVYQDKNDTQGYMDLIAFFDGQAAPSEVGRLITFKIRLLKPFYGIICSVITPLTTSYNAMLILNMALLFGTVILLFLLLNKYFKFKYTMSVLGITWFVCSYPMLKYGFSLMTDISGYFFIILTVFLSLIGFTKDKYPFFLAAGIAAGIGVTAKESGAFGLLFILAFSIFEIKNHPFSKTFKRLLLVGLPFLLIFGITNFTIYNLAHYSYYDFLMKAEEQYSENFRTLKFFIGTQLATFNLLWLPFFYGLYKIKKNKNAKTLFSLMFIGLPSYLWSVYIVRGLFIQYIFIIPIALFGTEYFYTNNKIGQRLPKSIKILLVSLPCLVSISLFIFSRGYSIWNLLGI